MGWWRETINIVKENDPAARTSLEVLLTYPGRQSTGSSPCFPLFVEPWL